MLKIVPKLYGIVDVAVLAASGVGVREFAEGLRAAGVGLVQLRDKVSPPREMLRNAAMVAEIFAGSGATLMMNDRADLAVLAGWDGVHVGQGDLRPEDAKKVLAAAENTNLGLEKPVIRPTHRERQGSDEWAADPWRRPSFDDRIVGVSTHTEAQVTAADSGAADYVAIGPVFATGTKPDAAPVVGLERVRRARALTNKPLVAIGGITRKNVRSVIDAGADSVAVISGFFVAGEPVEKVTRDFLELLR